MAVNETGLGDVNEKILKNEETGAVFWEYLKDKKSVGIINREPDEDGLIAVRLRRRSFYSQSCFGCLKTVR